MRTFPQSPGDIAIPQLLERERAHLASTALTIEESTGLLTLVEYYEALVTERQSQDGADRSHS